MAVRSNGGRNRRSWPRVEAIEKWSAGTANLAPDLARELRAPSGSLAGPAGLVRPGHQGPDTETLKKALPVTALGVSIEGAAREHANANPVLVVPRNARIGQMFTGLVLLNGGFPERAGEALPRLDALVTPAVPGVARHAVVAVLEVDDASLTDARLRSCGRRPVRATPVTPKDVDLLNALLWSEPPPASRRRCPTAGMAGRLQGVRRMRGSRR